jgi:tetratricopeptide (TPR) repeat protein
MILGNVPLLFPHSAGGSAMKKILFIAMLLLSLMVCVTSPAGAKALEDALAGIVAAQGGDYDTAINLFTKAIASGELSREDLSKVYYGRGFAWASKGAFDKAIVDYTEAIGINPNYADVYNSRGNAWEEKGDHDKAIADYTKAIEINPKYAEVYNNLAWLMATHAEDKYRDGKRAVELAEKGVALKDEAGFLDTLAAAYAEAGRFQDAIKAQEKAITKLKQEGGTKYLLEFEEHLATYKAGKPWREKYKSGYQ